MKKTFYIGVGVSCLLMSMASARTWTSATGGKTFEGDFKSYDEATGKVSVTRGSKKLSFSLDKLSDADKQWVAAKAEEIAKAEAEETKAKSFSLESQAIGSKLTSKVLTRLKGKRFARAEITKQPEYYILYFTASW